MDKIKEELAKEHGDFLVKLEKEAEAESIIKDNKIKFQIGEITYRVRLPNYSEQLEVEKHRGHKYLEFIKDSKMLFRKQWIEIYKAKGVDLEKMDREITEIQAKIDNFRIKSAQETKENQDKINQEILSLIYKQAIVNVEKNDLLSYCIEEQLMIEVNAYQTYIVLEKLMAENAWVKVYSTYEEFSKSEDSVLIGKAVRYFNEIAFPYTGK